MSPAIRTLFLSNLAHVGSMSKLAVATLTLAVIGMPAHAATPTLDSVMKKGFLQCGVSQGTPGFSNPDQKNHWNGLDVDMCRAVAAAIFGDPEKVKFTPLTGETRFTALQSGEIDVLARTTTWTLTRNGQVGVEFAGVDLYDGQGFMTHKSMNVSSAAQLDGATVCTNTGSTSELNMTDFFRAHKLKFTPVLFEKTSEVIAAYDSGRCDVYTDDRSSLASARTVLKNPADNVILPETISKEPLSLAVREGDDKWLQVVRWSMFVTLNAEELGVTSGNVDTLRKTADNPEIKRLLGTEGHMGAALKLPDDWAYNIIKTVGNYAEIYDRNLGPETPIGLPRGQNALWKDGGLMYGMPIR